jgi:hypothetical protein
MISVEEKDEIEMRNAKEHDRMALHRKLQKVDVRNKQVASKHEIFLCNETRGTLNICTSPLCFFLVWELLVDRNNSCIPTNCSL